MVSFTDFNVKDLAVRKDFLRFGSTRSFPMTGYLLKL